MNKINIFLMLSCLIIGIYIGSVLEIINLGHISDKLTDACLQEINEVRDSCIGGMK